MGAIALKQPMLQIDAKESRMLADAVIEVGKQYAVAVNPKLLAWMQLLGAGCAVYAPRAIMVIASRPKPAPKGNGGQPAQPAPPQPQPGGPVQTSVTGTERPLGSDGQPPIKF